MLEMSVFWLRVAAALYAFGLGHALLVVLRRSAQGFQLALGAFCIGVVLHFVSLTESSLVTHSFPVNNFHESISLCGFLSALLFLFVYWRYEFASGSIFLFPAVFFMTLVGSTATPVGSWSSPGVRGAWLGLHIVLVLIGYAALLLAAVSSLLYLVQERQLKSKRPARLFGHLPPLGTLDSLTSQAMSWGFFFITLALVAASGWAFVESGTRWIGQKDVTIAFITWAFYLLMVFLRVSAGWRGRKAALLVLAVLGCSALTWVAHVGLLPHLVQ